MEVKKADPGDIKNLVRFFERAWKEAGFGALGWTGATEETISMIADHDFLLGLLNRRDTCIYVSYLEDDLVGFSSLREIKSDVVELSGIIVLESKTGMGVGSKLLEAAVELAKRCGYSEIIVKTERENERALGFYMSKGFRKEKMVTENVEGEDVTLVQLALRF